MSSSSAESTDYFLKQLFRSVNEKSNYIRIEPSNLSSIDPSMDAASKTNIQKIVSLADKLVSENEELLDQIVSDLIADKPSKKDDSIWRFLKK